MKRFVFALILIGLLTTSCTSQSQTSVTSIPNKTPRYNSLRVGDKFDGSNYYAGSIIGQGFYVTLIFGQHMPTYSPAEIVYFYVPLSNHSATYTNATGKIITLTNIHLDYDGRLSFNIEVQ